MKAEWLNQLEIIVRKHNATACNINEWERWEDWSQYFESGMSPNEAYMDSIRENPKNIQQMFGMGMS